MLYVDDLILAYDAFIQSDIKHAVWNTGGGIKNTTSLNEFIDFLGNELGTWPELTFSDWRPSDQKVYISDLSKISKDLNWEPKVSPEQGYRKLIDWVKTTQAWKGK